MERRSLTTDIFRVANLLEANGPKMTEVLKIISKTKDCKQKYGRKHECLVCESYLNPHPGMPMVMMTQTTTWAKKTKKKRKKLKELSLLEEEKNNHWKSWEALERVSPSVLSHCLFFFFF